MWVNKKGYPYYVSRETWITRYWLWRRVARAAAGAQPHPRRVAAILLSYQGRINGLPAEHLEDLEQWLLAYDLAHPGPLLCVESAYGRVTTKS